MFEFTKNVWAVGQGGFASGVLKDVNKQHVFSYVYDCGSDQTTVLGREIGHAHQQCDRLNTVFLSHLDSDHVNGFDRLCGAFKGQIDEVVLPYLDHVSKYYSVAKELATNAPSIQFLDYLVNPSDWTRSRLPNATITLLGSADVNELEGVNLPDPLENRTNGDPGNGAASIGRSTDLGVPGDADERYYQWVSFAPTSKSSLSTPIQIIASTPPRSNAQLAAFERSLNAAGFDNLSEAKLRAVLRDSIWTAKLRDCYLKLASDHNIVSIHLLVRTTMPTRIHHCDNYQRHQMEYIKNISYLFSGDAKLSVELYFKHWKATFEKYLDEVSVFSLPHHGSLASFNAKLISVMPNALFIAQAGKNGHGHPDDDVTDSIKLANREFHQVAEHRSSRLYCHCSI